VKALKRAHFLSYFGESVHLPFFWRCSALAATQLFFAHGRCIDNAAACEFD
jgi:hypothetical protein